jgi:hypothetical protein
MSLRDKLIASAQTQGEWLTSSARVSKTAIDGKASPLPHPWRKKVPGLLEAQIMREVRSVLARSGCWYRRIEGGGKLLHSGSVAVMAKSEMVGMPDWIACQSGRLLGIEVKAPGGKVSASQVATLSAMQIAGARVCICVSASALMDWVHGWYLGQETVEGILVVG